MGDTHKLSVSVNLTTDGFMSQECPACERIFKVNPESPEPVTHCPYCDHEGTDWWTKAQAEYFGAYAANEVLGPQLDEMAREFNRRGRSNDLIKLSVSVKKSSVPKPPEEPDDMTASITFDCCQETILHDGHNPELHCAICGTKKAA